MSINITALWYYNYMIVSSFKCKSIVFMICTEYAYKHLSRSCAIRRDLVIWSV